MKCTYIFNFLNSLSSNNISSKGASTLFDTLIECKSPLISIYLGGNNLDDECIKSLGEFLQYNSTIEFIDIGFTRPLGLFGFDQGSNLFGGITDSGIEALAPYLFGNSSLKSLQFLFQNITSQSIPILKEMIEKSCLQYLNLYRTQIPPEAIRDFAPLLSTPIDQREIPIISKSTKSAAKIDN